MKNHSQDSERIPETEPRWRKIAKPCSNNFAEQKTPLRAPLVLDRVCLCGWFFVLMKRSSAFSLLFVLLSGSLTFPQSPTTEAADPFHPVLDRLQSLGTLALQDWRFHADMPHPEDPALDDSSWAVVKLDERWSTGARVFRRLIEIPEKQNGYSTSGATVKLDLAFDSNGPLMITVFSNGALVYHGSDSQQQPILLTERAQSALRFAIAIRLDAQQVETRISSSRLLIDPPPSRPSPALLREEILAVRPLIAAYPEGKAEREQQLDTAVKAIDFLALDRGDPGAFDASLRQAQSRLELLRPWLQQFSIRAVGNSHIDMAWLWP
jgi:alpha-mannosidase